MLCEKCKTREATVLIREIVNGNTTERHLCGQCAQENGIGALFDADSAFGRLLSGILGRGIGKDQAAQDSGKDIVCPCCGMSYAEFVKDGKFGCSECYETFGLLIHDNIKKLQGSDSHVGKRPKGYPYIRAQAGAPEGQKTETDEETLEILLARQKEAVRDEDYEEAAALRDRIRSLREKMEAGR